MSLADLKRLLIIRNHVNSKLTNIETFAKQFVVGSDTNEIKNRIEEMYKIRQEFESVNLDIMCIEDTSVSEDGSSSEPKADFSEATTFDTLWYKVLSLLQSLLEQVTPIAPNNQSPFQPSQLTQFNVKLPVINLPTFSGKHTEWLPFYDAFQSLVHNNNSLDNCQKFHYLKSCLKNEAARAIESLSISSDNYQSAWLILQKRYKNTRLIIQGHVQAILNSPELTKCSSESLQKLIEDVTNNLEALKVLKIPVESWDAILVMVILNKLDYQTRREFENSLDSNPLKLTQVMDFLEKKRNVLESINLNTRQKSYDKPNIQPSNTYKKGNFNRASNAVSFSKVYSCYFCKGHHFISQCEDFLRLSVNERTNEVKKRNLCINCLRSNHKLSECKSSGCLTCQSRQHHTLIHVSRPATEQPLNLATNHCASPSKLHVLLSTAIVLVKDSSDNYRECRALLDVGSQVNLLSESMAQILNLKTKQRNISLSGISDTCSNTTKFAKITLKSIKQDFETIIDCCVLNRVTSNLPTESFGKDALGIPANIQLADPNFNRHGPIDLLLGADTFWALMCVEKIKLSNPNLYLSKTLLGWVVGGAFVEKRKTTASCHVVTKQTNDDLSDLLERFWVQENVGPAPNDWTNEEIECENQFIKTYRRDQDDGRFIVKLPFKNNTVNLGDSERNAIRRFFSLEKKFRNCDDFKITYSNAIHDLIKSSYLKEVKPQEIKNKHPNQLFYLPHSGVFKRDQNNPKIRIVYDGSAKSSNGLSLNDNLMTGPNLQNDSFAILLRFRTHPIVISCDMEKMFLQIKIDPDDANFQLLFWRFSENERIKIYRLTRLVFGLTNSPYTAMRCVQQLALEAETEFKAASRVLIKDRFMDDILSGSSTVREGIELRDQLIEIVGRGGFSLSKWNSNVREIIPNFCLSNSGEMVDLSKGESAKVLGLWWDPSSDTLNYRIQSHPSTEYITKRTILSSIAKIYDPIGIISPILIRAKILMQKLWTLKIDWDESVPQAISNEWLNFVKDLESINEIKIPRIIIAKSDAKIDLVMFCDASLYAYGAAIYTRTEIGCGTFTTKLICTKSRVSPIKIISLPRLELSAALLGTELMDRVSRELNLNIDKKYYFTDSMIVLHYLNANANTWQVFVANRVSKIQSLSNIENWLHVDGINNPADIISRGISPDKMISKLYWEGPEFLSTNQSDWPENRFKPTIQINSLPEKRKNVLIASLVSPFSLLTKFSSFINLQRVTAYCLRFSYNSRNKNNKRTGVLTNQELAESHNVIIKIVQESEFFEEQAALQNKQPCPRNSKLLCLDPFVDNNGLIRLGGRIRQSSFNFDKKFPILLPAKHHVTQLLIRKEHLCLLHAGVTQTLASLRSKYWPLKARNEVKKIIRACILCFRVSPRLMEQKMGDLPKDRLVPCRPFKKVGLDYFGPIFLKMGGKRSPKITKGWVALFVCLVTRAIHLEVVSDLTTECFLNALKRFCSRRGHVSHIYCDNAKTFIGANRHLNDIFKTLNNTELQSYLIQDNITWKFIPPRSPNFGGLWERLVKSTKHHLKRVTMNANLTFEEAVTLLTQIEAVINSRPLTPLSNDPSDLQALTPAHFLIGESLTSLPEHDVIDIPESRLNRWERIQKIKQHFWKRWSSEVVSQLQSRSKWQQPSPVLNVGSLVLVAEDNLPPMVWKLGRIEAVHPGPDGLVRVAAVRTSQGLYTRSVRKLAALPIIDDDKM